MENIAEKVHEMFLYCLFKDEEVRTLDVAAGTPPANAVLVEGITNKFGLHSGRVAEKREEVRAMLDEMPAQFHRDSGGGWSFLNLCDDKHGVQWADNQATMQELVVLAIASGFGKMLMPREMWPIMPGGMPYIEFNTAESKPYTDKEHEARMDNMKDSAEREE
jgi:hypothetical protein